MLEQLKSSGVLTSEQVREAQAHLSEMNEKEVQGLIEKAGKKVNDPKIRKMLQEGVK